MTQPLCINQIEAAVDAVLDRISGPVALGLPLGIGKSELECHFLEPLVARVFGDYPDLEYVKDLRDRHGPEYRRILESLCPDGLDGRELGRFDQGLYCRPGVCIHR